jgi:hypothetical protein
MTDITLRSLNTVPEPELAALSDEVFGHEQPSELLADVVAAEAHAYSPQTDEKQPGTFGLAALRGNKLVGWTEGFRVGSIPALPSQSDALGSIRNSYRRCSTTRSHMATAQCGPFMSPPTRLSSLPSCAWASSSRALNIPRSTVRWFSSSIWSASNGAGFTELAQSQYAQLRDDA